MVPTALNRMKPGQWAQLMFLSLLWGGSFFFGEIALTQVPPFTLVLGRVSLATLVLHLIVRAVGQQLPTSRRVWSTFLLMGLLNNLIPYSLIFWGQTQISSSLAAILNATTPLWTVLLAHLFTRDERLTPGRLGGVLLGLVGVVMMIGPDVLAGLGLNVLGQLAVVGAALSYAAAGIYGKQYQRMSPLVVATGQMSSTTVLMIPLAAFVDQPWRLAWPTWDVWAAVLGLALLGTALAYVIYFRLLASVGATNLLLVTFLIPVSAILLGTLILDEELAMRHVAGMALIGMGLLAIDGRALGLLRYGTANSDMSRATVPDDLI